MTMPPDPGTGTTPSMDTAGDPAGAVSSQSQSELYQDQLNAAVTAEQSADHGLQGLYDQLNQLGPDPGDVDSITGGPGPKSQQWIKQTQDLDRQIQAASSQLATAKRDTASVYNHIATDASTRARTQGQTPLWSAQAQSATAAAQYKSAQANLLDAYGAQKDQATIQKLQDDAAKAQQQVQLIGQQTATSASVQALNSAKAVQITETTPAVLQMDAARTQVYASQVAANNARANTLIPAQADLANARAAYISGPEAQSMLSKAELDAAKAKGLDLTQGATLDKIQAAAGLSNARIAQIYANVGKSQVLPYTDRTSPNLTVFQPSTGSVTGVPNPGYVNTTMQGISDTNNAIQEVQNEIASGQMTSDEGTALISNLRQALQYKALGVTPDQFLQAQQSQANLGMNVLNNYMGTLEKGQGVAQQFLDAAAKTRNLPAGMNFNPFGTFGQIANAVYGPSLANAQNLINQVQPVTDKFSALKAISQLSQVKQHLTDAAQQSGAGTPDQTQQGGIGAVQAATDQAGGGSAQPLNPAVTAGIMPQQLQGQGMS